MNSCETGALRRVGPARADSPRFLNRLRRFDRGSFTSALAQALWSERWAQCLSIRMIGEGAEPEEQRHVPSDIIELRTAARISKVVEFLAEAFANCSHALEHVHYREA